MAHPVKVVVVGDDGIGKTSLLISHFKDRFPVEDCSSTLYAHSAEVVIKGKTYPYEILDTADADRLRPLNYPQTDVFLVCFSVDSADSFDHCRDKWFPELEYHSPGVPRVLAATRIDLRNDCDTVEALVKEHRRPISTEQGRRLTQELNAWKYAECSGRTKEGLADLFDKVFDAALEGRARPTISRPQDHVDSRPTTNG
ncbi:Small GTPase CDC42 [Mycena indigotica]|uniref:Small GTPase CDC42 n=1 Tax=Mycena indigotica TaxID=2126181 RepID=A0A8H6TFE0_9AGAR|nr:Small GTPase CDC42 [Mycena indigotica]KAF7316249.1 Small GTPase CDC42 [Mycena indigotica]